MRQVLVGVSAAVVLLSPLAGHADTVTVSGVALQVTAPKVRGGQTEGKLEQDADVTVEGQRLPLKAGKNVAWWTSTSELAKGTLREPVTVQIGGKSWNLAGGTELNTASMSGKTMLQTVKLAGPHTITVDGITFTTTADTAQFSATSDRFISNFRTEPVELTLGGVHATLPAGTYVGFIDGFENGQKVQHVWSVQAQSAAVPTIDLWGKTFQVQVISYARDGSGRLERVKFRSSVHPVGGQDVKLGEVRFTAGGEPETVELAGKQKVMVDGAEHEAFNAKYFVSADFKFMSKTKEGLAKLVGSAPVAAAPAAAATPPTRPGVAAPAVAPAPPAAPPKTPPGRPGLMRPGSRR